MILTLLLQVGIACNSIPPTGITPQCTVVPVVISSLITGLNRYYNLNEASGTRNDSLGVANLTDVNTVDSGAGKLSNAAVFLPANVETLEGSSILLISDFTVSVWVKPDNLGMAEVTWGRGIVANHTGETIGDWHLAVLPDGKVRFIHWSSSGIDATGGKTTDSAFLSDGNWAHLVFRKIGATYTIWINGVSRSFTSNTSSLGWQNRAFLVGQIDDSTQPYMWQGSIDELGVWTRGLTDVEIGTLYNLGNGISYPF